MKICFICGSLEEGKDGVGDYVRRLAGEMIRENHNVQIFAIHDRFISEVWTGTQADGTQNIHTLRLPATNDWSVRLKILNIQIADFNPEWLSLQYVPFSFQTKGLPFTLSHNLKRISNEIRWHIMFHELWVGINVESHINTEYGECYKNLSSSR